MNIKSESDNLYFLSCDWGTSSFRLKLVEMNTGKIIKKISDTDGIQTVFKNWSKEKKNNKDRINFYLSVLQNKILALNRKIPQEIEVNSVPIIVSGMASSTIGIIELPYHKLPIRIDDYPDLYVKKIDAAHLFNHDVYIISGIRTTDDLIRGEETQLLGLTSKLTVKDGLYLLIGTHSKHIIVKDNTVTTFKTYMTGELFDVLSKQSILSNSISNAGTVRTSNGAFERGVVNASSKENILNALFQIRANHTLGKMSNIENYSYLSGLLIGMELKDLNRENNLNPIFVWGNIKLQGYYAAALNILDITYHSIENDPEEDITALGQRMVLRGLL